MEIGLRQFHIWSSKNLQNKLYTKKNKQHYTVFCAEEAAINENFDPGKVKNSSRIRYLIGSAGIEDFYKKYTSNSHTEFWYNYFLFHSFNLLDVSNLGKKSKVSSLFISLNNRPHPHRCCLVDILAKYKLIDNNIISWNNLNHAGYKWLYWKPRYMNLHDGFGKSKSQHTLPSQYNQALFNLISESWDSVIFVTEKTWNAILAGKPFLVQGAPGFHRFLQSKGYKIFDNVIDYSFDNEQNTYKRTEMLVKELKKLENCNYKKIWKKLKPICDYNKKVALDHIRTQNGVPPMAKEFIYYKRTIENAICRLDTLE
jgi:hypothetical protein